MVVEAELVAHTFGAVVFEDCFEAGDDFGVLFSEVGGFGWVFLEVIELPWSGSFAFCFLADRFPREVDDSELATVAVEFPDHGFGSFEGTCGEGGGEVGSVEILRCICFCEGAEGGEPIGEVRGGGGDGAGFDFCGPADDGGD